MNILNSLKWCKEDNNISIWFTKNRNHIQYKILEISMGTYCGLTINNYDSPLVWMVINYSGVCWPPNTRLFKLILFFWCFIINTIRKAIKVIARELFISKSDYKTVKKLFLYGILIFGLWFYFLKVNLVNTSDPK